MQALISTAFSCLGSSSIEKIKNQDKIRFHEYLQSAIENSSIHSKQELKDIFKNYVYVSLCREFRIL